MERTFRKSKIQVRFCKLFFSIAPPMASHRIPLSRLRLHPWIFKTLLLGPSFFCSIGERDLRRNYLLSHLQPESPPPLPHLRFLEKCLPRPKIYHHARTNMKIILGLKSEGFFLTVCSGLDSYKTT